MHGKTQICAFIMFWWDSEPAGLKWGKVCMKRAFVLTLMGLLPWGFHKDWGQGSCLWVPHVCTSCNLFVSIHLTTLLPPRNCYIIIHHCYRHTIHCCHHTIQCYRHIWKRATHMRGCSTVLFFAAGFVMKESPFLQCIGSLSVTL